MEMPVDILNRELGAIRDNGDIDFDNTNAAVNIDAILQEKFIVIPQEEIDAIEIEHTNEFSAGSGPEHCAAGENENPAWLYNHALNALALWKHLKERERLEEEQREIERKHQENVARRPVPGVYSLDTQGSKYTVIVTVDRRILCPNSIGGGVMDFTSTFDGMGNKAAWTFTLIETGLSA